MPGNHPAAGIGTGIGLVTSDAPEPCRQLAAFFESLPCAAWRVDRSQWQVAIGNSRAAAYQDGRRTAAVDELDQLFQFPDEIEASVSRHVAAAFSSAAEEHSPASLRAHAGSKLLLVTWPLLEEGRVIAVGIVALDWSPQETLAPPEWWLRMGHDLRGPITPMRMAVQLLRSGRASPPDQDNALRLIDRQIDLLLAIIDDQHALLRINAGAFKWNAVPGDLNLLLDVISARGTLLRALEAKQQQLHCVVSDSPIIANHDPERLAALLEFLLCKASEHALPGTPITVKLQPEGAHAQFLITGSEGSLVADAELAYVAHSRLLEIGELEAKPLLMREFARLSQVSFDQVGHDLALAFRLPVLAPGHEALNSPRSGSES